MSAPDRRGWLARDHPELSRGPANPCPSSSLGQNDLHTPSSQ
jgi:hypothetical protein